MMMTANEVCAREVAREREIDLAYVRDVRELLGNNAQQEGIGFQAYRDRWSKLCRRLCDVNGKPILTAHVGGKHGQPRTKTFTFPDDDGTVA
jgi:hypothetical protein